MSNGKKILVIGGAAMTLIANLSGIPEQGERMVEDGATAYLPGGDGISAAVAFAALDNDCFLVTKLGADVHGQKLYKFSKDTGVDTSFIKVDHDHQTGFNLTLRVAEDEDRTAVYPGANGYITTEALMEAFSSSPDGVYIGLDLPFATVLTAARIAADRGIPIFMDGAVGSKELELENLPEIEVLTVNEEEAIDYSGLTPGNMESSFRATLAICRRIKCKNVVIKQGQRGAFIYDGKRYTTSPAYKAEKSQYCGSARYAFSAALATEYLYSNDIRSAVRYASAAGALAKGNPGIFSSPKTSEIEDLIRSQQK